MAVVRLRGGRFLWLSVALCFCIVIYLATSNSLLDIRDRVVLKNLVEAAVDQGRFIKSSPGHIACQRPSLPVDSDDVLRFFHKIEPLECDPEQDWVVVKGHQAVILKEAKKRHGGNIECTFTDLVRGSDDDTVTRESSFKTQHVFTFTVSDHCSVSCSATDGTTWSSLLAGVRKNVQAVGSVPSDGLNVSVVMIGLDSLSHNTYMRTLPKTYKYLTSVLQADVLDGFNILGDGTAQALIPLFTGKTELELPETRHRVGSHAQHVDIYPYIWKDYAQAGYITMYAEDMPQMGTFNYRLRGFKDQPTHHYIRPFYLTLDQELNSHPKFCLRARPRHKVYLDYIYNFMWTYRSQPVFSVTLHGELSHDDVNLVSVADQDIVDTLTKMKNNGLLDNTILVMYSDHGHRFQSIRSTQQGKQEERLPFVSLVVPEKIKRNYPAAYQNVRANTDRLVTAFDIHATLKDILHYSGAKIGQLPNRSISLFSQIPSSRTCRDAFIETHWCACLTWESIPVTDERVRQAAKALLHYINSHTAPYRGLCHEMTLSKITWAAIMLPTSGMMTFKRNADMDGYVPNMDDKTPVTEEAYEVHIVTEPTEAAYEATLSYSIKHDTFSVRLSDISRTNKYGNNPRCIMEVDADLAKYCVCRDQQS